jgi:hypothetical protein
MSSLYALVAAFVASNAFALGEDGHDLIRTPHGYRPAKCVHFAETGSILKERENYTEVYNPTSGLTTIIERDEDCVKNARGLLRTWVDYTGWTTTSAVGNFTSVYTIPNENPTSSGQLLYYFIGFQNNDDAAVTIVQPVVNYCGNCGQYSNGWSMEPWNCCPNGQSWYGSNQKISAGDSVNAWVYAEGSGGNVVIGMSKGSNSPTTLTVADNSRTFDWACATLEEYDVTTCSSYNSQPFGCTQMEITALNGQKLTPSWSATGQSRCDGGPVINSPADVEIYGTNKP